MNNLKKFLFCFLISLISFNSFNQTLDKYYQDGKVIFQFKTNYDIPLLKSDGFDIIDADFINSVIDEYGITGTYFLHPEIRDKRLANTVEIEFEEIFKIYELISYLESFDFIEYAEQKELHYTTFSPNDQYYNQQYQWSLFKINAESAWGISTGLSSIVVAVTDDAIVTSHPELVNKLVPGRDVAEGTNDPNPVAGGATGAHGTHVSGIVGAETNNSIGIASIGFDISIMPIKISRNSDGALTAGFQGIIWAADNGADIINMSWGGYGSSNYGQNVCNYAWNNGSILVGGAGNDNVTTAFYPAAYNNVIAVASTTSDDSKSDFSQYGTWISISAPGSNIVSCSHTGEYAYASGTSMASPLVAGLLGLMKSANPSLSNIELINCLFSSADNIDAVNPDYINQLGYGRINAHSALLCVTASDAEVDAGIKQIIQPTGGTCESTINPVVVLHNYGTVDITSVTINYRITGQELQSYNWTGNLEPDNSETVNLPSMTSPMGQQNFRAYTSDPNGEQDMNPYNDEKNMPFGIFTTGIPIPWSEDFESETFNTNLWTVENPDEDITWEIYTTQGTEPGNKSAGINLFNYGTTGQRDGLLTPPLSFVGYETVELSFEHAYRRRNTSISDSLIIYASIDCGETFQRLAAYGEDGNGIFATATTSGTNFVPVQESDWCISGTVGTSCFTVNLNAFAGEDNVIIKFESYNNQGNNLYIDNINIDGQVIDYDIGISQIINPQTNECIAEIIPEVRLFNFGGSTITSANIHYKLNSEEEQIYEWTGSIASNESEIVFLPLITASFGENQLYVFTSEPNGSPDLNPSNDGLIKEFNVITHGVPLPFTEDFESGSFNTNNWTIESPDIATTWDIYTVSGNSPGNKAAGINFFFYEEIGERDAIITPALDFSEHSAVFLDFEHAYRRFDQSSTDSLIIYISTDCGNNYQRIFAAGEDGSGSFATVFTSEENFMPAYESDWCHTGSVGTKCFKLNLSEWAGESMVNIKFETYNNSGNNLFIDNINIESLLPVADFRGTPLIIEVGETVDFTDLSQNFPDSWYWEFEGGEPAESYEQNPTGITYNSEGTFNVTLTVDNGEGSDMITKTNYIIVVSESIECNYMNNIQEGEGFASYGYANGYVTGHNDNGFSEFAEYFENPYGNNLTNVVIAIFRATALSSNAILTLKVWDNNSGLPGNVIYSEDIEYELFTIGTYNNITLSENVTVPNEFFVGYEIYYETPRDLFAIYHVQNRGDSSPYNSTAYIKYNNVWSNTENLFSETLNTSFLIYPRLCPPDPVAEFTANNTEGCGSVITQFNNMSQGDAIIYEWNFGDGNISGEQNPQHEYTEPGIYSVSLTVTNSVGSDTYIINDLVTVYPVPEINLGNNIAECGPTIIDAGSGFENYTWNGEPGEQTISVTVTGSYTVVAEDSNGCTASDEIYVTIYPDLSLSISVTNVSEEGAEDGSAIVNVTGGTLPFDYEWSNYETTQEITGLSAGTYHVTVKDNNNCSATASANVYIEGAGPVANFETDINSGCGEITVQFTDISENSPETWYWDFGNGNNSEEQNPIHEYNEPGTYTVSLTVTSPIGTDTYVADDLISVYPVPEINLGNDIEECGPTIIDAGSGFENYIWNDEPGEQTISITETGNYTVVAEDIYGCTATDEIFVTIHPVPEINLGNDIEECGQAIIDAGSGFENYTWNGEPGEQTISITETGNYTVVAEDIYGCTATDEIFVTIHPVPEINLGDDIEECGQAIVDAGSGFENYTWNGEPGEQTINITETGNYTVVAEDINGCTASDEIYVTIYPEITINISVTNESDIGAGDGSAIVNVTGGTLPLDYKWSNDETTQEITGLSVGAYHVTVTDANNCSATASANVNVEGIAPVADFEADVTSGCNELTVQFTDLSENNPESWLWNFGDGNNSEEQNPEHTYTIPGAYTVSLAVFNEGGTTNKIIENYILVGETPVFTVETTPATGQETADGEAWVEITAGIPPYQYYWSTEETTESISGLLPGAYSVIIRDAYNCMATKPFVIEWVSLVDNEHIGFAIYPNPTNGMVFIEFDVNTPKKTIEVIDAIGKTLKTINTELNNINIDLSNVPKGLYFIKLITKDRNLTKKLIVE